MDFKKLDMSDESLVHLLNFILSMIREDRTNALAHHDTLTAMLEGAPGVEAMDGVTMQVLLADISGGLSSFLKNSAQSTDQAIKVAKILADHLTKIDRSDDFTEEDRDSIQKMVEKISEEKDLLMKDIDKLGE